MLLAPPRYLAGANDSPCPRSEIESPHPLLQPQHQERQPQRGTLLVRERPALPGEVHRPGGVASLLIHLSRDRRQHLLETRI